MLRAVTPTTPSTTPSTTSSTTSSTPPAHSQPPQPAPGPGWRLVYQDAHLLVADKPAGLLCVPGRGPELADCLASRVQAEFADALVVHRLDMATSGLVLLARGAAWQRQLSITFAARQVHKRYEAVVGGLLVGPGGALTGEINLPLAADWPQRPRQKVDHATGKPSLTRWRVVSHDALHHTTRLALEPVTGRTHQLRLHLAAIDHPILGDALYAPPALAAAAPRLLLHACELALHGAALGNLAPSHATPGDPAPGAPALAWRSPAPF